MYQINIEYTSQEYFLKGFIKNISFVGSSRAKGGHASVDPKNIIKVHRYVRRDGVDEKCDKQNIKYYKWTGTKGSGLHPGQVKTSTSMMDYVPQQNPNTDCILCPKVNILEIQFDMQLHFRRVHIAKLLVVHNVNILMCRCSNIRSRGSDNSVHNHHYHCITCWHPFDTGAKLRVHKLAKHSDVYGKLSLLHLKP